MGVVRDPGGTDPLGAAQRLELCQQLVERGRCGAGGPEQVELVAAGGNPFGGERTAFDRGRRRVDLERGLEPAQPWPWLGRRRRQPQPAHVAGAARAAAGAGRELERQLELRAGQMACAQPAEQAPEQAAQHERERLEAIQRHLEVDGLLELRLVRSRDRWLAGLRRDADTTQR